MAVTMIPLQPRHRSPTQADLFARRRLTAGVLVGLLLVIAGLAARPHLVAPDVRPASSVGSNQINVDTGSAGDAQLQRVNDVTGSAGIPAHSSIDHSSIDHSSIDRRAVASGRGMSAIYTVQPGDSLWSIAASRVASSHVDAYLSSLIALNGAASLTPGQQLMLPS